MNNKSISSKRYGFTLSEVLVVTIIIGTLMALAVPRFSQVLERAKIHEQTNILMNLYIAQKDYFRENGQYASSLSDLDVEVSPSEFYAAPVVQDATNIGTACNGKVIPYIARSERVNSSYILYLAPNGEVFCAPCDGICSQLGIRPYSESNLAVDE